jgi:hypothetical protein
MTEKMNKGLEQYYSGDSVWKTLTRMAEEDYWVNSEYQQELVRELNGHKDIAMVVFARESMQSHLWIKKRIPALEGLTPLKCLESDSLILRLKECLIRMK